MRGGIHEMMNSGEKDAQDRHLMLCEALDGNKSKDPSVARQRIMKAYGLNSSIGQEDLVKVAKSELRFAEECLAGKGIDAQGITGKFDDLRMVILIEIGLAVTTKNLGPPWLLGDWKSMCNIVLNIANAQLSMNRDMMKKHNPRSYIRLWPVSFDGAKVIDGKELMWSSAYLCRDKNSEGKFESIRVQIKDPKKIFRGLASTKWIKLPYGPEQCKTIFPGDYGIPPNRWWLLDGHPKSFGN